MSSSMGAASWHSNCLDLFFSPKAEYEIRVGVSEVDSTTPKAMLVVMVEGGGIELS
jgi:hypothetical protein